MSALIDFFLRLSFFWTNENIDIIASILILTYMQLTIKSVMYLGAAQREDELSYTVGRHRDAEETRQFVGAGRGPGEVGDIRAEKDGSDRC